MVSKTIIVLISLIFLVISLEFRPSNAQTRIRVGYYWYEQDSSFLLSDINSTLFTHLVCGFASVNSTTNQLYVSSSDEKYMSIFTNTVKQKNPSVTTLLTIGSGTGKLTYSSMLMSNSTFRKSFIESSIRLARLYGFQGLDIWWISSDIISLDMINIIVLLQEWRAAIVSEARNSNKSQLILTAMANSSPNLGSGSYPIGSFRKYLDWVHIMSSEYTNPEETYFTGAHAALYNPTTNVNTDHGLTSWINTGLSANKLVLCLPFYGFAWTLVNPRNNGVGAPATGPAITEDGAMTYKSIKNYIKKSRANNVSYAKEKGLLGYFVWQISYDDKWVLSQAAADQERSNFLHQKDNKQLRQVLVIVFTTAAAILLISFVIYFSFLKKLKLIGRVNFARESKNIKYYPAAAGDFNSNAHELWKDGRGMEFLDPSLDDLHSTCKKMRCLQIALLCVQEIPNDRPNMLEVSSMLKNETKYVKIPKKPAFSKQTNEDEEQNDESTSKPELCSVSDAPFTEVLAR
ncbi:hypothetical protein EZV62_007655 [Acer yangbiense]|uniref:GH18 domain-containing protein n=1 Tax=Acer yangbiense TaxID=1000413 RepID=A0A5C7IAL7_9ROSI|nr:hypothetical protein EZV62_007655 [Acer yangbiense]